MPGRVKLDEDLSPLVAEPLRSAGYDVATVSGQGWGGMKDQELWERLAGESCLFITADKGFGDIRAYPPGSHGGILLLRAHRDSILEYRALIEKVIARRDLLVLQGTLAVASARGLRVRRE